MTGFGLEYDVDQLGPGGRVVLLAESRIIVAPLRCSSQRGAPVAGSGLEQLSRVSLAPSLPLQDHITPEELAELEAAEGWVSMLAELEDLEDEHLIAVALK